MGVGDWGRGVELASLTHRHCILGTEYSNIQSTITEIYRILLDH